MFIVGSGRLQVSGLSRTVYVPVKKVGDGYYEIGGYDDSSSIDKGLWNVPYHVKEKAISPNVTIHNGTVIFTDGDMYITFKRKKDAIEAGKTFDCNHILEAEIPSGCYYMVGTIVIDDKEYPGYASGIVEFHTREKL